ncbi:MAG: VWA domain-containing protein [Phycisphaerales bacterium]
MLWESLIGDGLEFAERAWVHGIWGVGAVILVLVLISGWRSRAGSRFVDSNREGAVLGKRRGAVRFVRWGMLGLGLVLVVVSVMRPRSNPHQEQAESVGRDIVFLVDVSKSMLARDVAPNRLERAKLWITDMVSELKTDRVALVAFAGSSSVRSPLTTDRLFFDLALDELSPAVVDVGGTNIGDAIRKSMEMVFYDLENAEAGNHRDIILITDGEDQDSLPVEAAAAAGEQGIRLLALGIGSRSGARLVDEENRPIRSNGAQVRSKLESGTLSQIATATPGGAYLEIGTGDVDLAEVYSEFIKQGDQTVFGTATVTRWDERYALALGPGLILICIELVLAGLGSRREVEL